MSPLEKLESDINTLKESIRLTFADADRGILPNSQAREAFAYLTKELREQLERLEQWERLNPSPH